MDPGEMTLELVRPLDDEHEFGYCLHREVVSEGGWLVCPNCGDWWMSRYAAPFPKLVIREVEHG